MLRKLSSRSRVSVERLRRASEVEATVPSTFAISVGFSVVAASYLVANVAGFFITFRSEQLTIPSSLTSFEQVFIYETIALHESFTSRAPALEQAIFTALTDQAIRSVHSRSMATVNHDAEDSPSLFSRAVVGLWQGLLRVAYLCLWWLRFVLVGAPALVIWYLSNSSVHEGADVLGRFGTGQPFYSGLRLLFRRVDERGEVDVLAPGVVTLPCVIGRACDSHPMAQFLRAFDAWNKTNEILLGYFLAAPEYPAWVGPKGLGVKHAGNATLLAYAELNWGTWLPATVALREPSIRSG